MTGITMQSPSIADGQMVVCPIATACIAIYIAIFPSFLAGSHSALLSPWTVKLCAHAHEQLRACCMGANTTAWLDHEYQLLYSTVRYQHNSQHYSARVYPGYTSGAV